MDRLFFISLVVLAFTGSTIAAEPGDQQITVVFREGAMITGELPVKTTGRLPNGDLKIFGERTMTTGHGTVKYTLSGEVRRSDLSAAGVVNVEQLFNIDIRKETLPEVSLSGDSACGPTSSHRTSRSSPNLLRRIRLRLTRSCE